MALHNPQTLHWQEHKNGITVDCSLDVAVTPAETNLVLLIIPGVDGSVDGYEEKYKRIAESVHNNHGVAVVRTSNPFISSYHWESNIRRILEFIQNNKTNITGSEQIEVRIMAHSAGASIVAQIAHEYPNIKRLLLINPATKLGYEKINEGLEKFNGNINILMGSADPSIEELRHLNIDVIEGADHYFSGDSLNIFIEAPNKYLFNR